MDSLVKNRLQRRKTLSIFIITIASVVLIVLFILTALPSSKTPTGIRLIDYCRMRYKKTGNCPSASCEIGCSWEPTITSLNASLKYGNIEQEKECPIDCNPKPCISFSVKDCSLRDCRIVTTCDGKRICDYRVELEESRQGWEGYYGEASCREGLLKRCGRDREDGSCDFTKGVHENIPMFPICVPCGNGVCDWSENTCSCPEDCK